MRPIWLILPSFLALASAAGLWVVAMKAKSDQPVGLYEDPKHPVTSAMMVKTGGMTAKTAPSFSVKDMNGKALVIAGTSLKRPQLVYFVNNDCPCSYAAEPLFHSLADQFKGQIDFVAVTNAAPDKAKKWIDEMQVEYSLVSDPKVEIMKAYEAPSSAYSALVMPNGKIDRMWPGFSRDLLRDMNREMAKATNQPEKPFDTQYAPIKPATGCSF